MAYKAEERTLESLKSGTEPGSIHPPLFDLPLKNVIPDQLHLLLRITDRLIENLINGAIQHDSPRSKPLEGEMVKALLQQVRSCGVPFTITDKKPNKYEFMSLTGTDRKKLLLYVTLLLTVVYVHIVIVFICNLTHACRVCRVIN